MHTFKKHGFAWIMFAIFVGSISVHWVTAYYVYEDEQKQHGQPMLFNGYLMEVTRQTFENIQSEALQLLLQVTLIAYFWYVGSPQSKEGQDRLEEKIDYVAGQLNPIGYERFKNDIEQQYPKK